MFKWLCLALLLYNWDVHGAAVTTNSMQQPQPTREANMASQQQQQQDTGMDMEEHENTIYTGFNRIEPNSSENSPQFRYFAKRPRPLVSNNLFQKITFWSRDVLNNVISVCGLVCNILMVYTLATIGDKIERSVKVYYISLAIFGIMILASRSCMNAFSYTSGFGSFWYATLSPYVQAFAQRVLKSCSLWLAVIICLQRFTVCSCPIAC